MKQVLVFCVQTLATLLKSCCSSDIDQHLLTLLTRLLAIIEQIFGWEFTHPSHILYILIFTNMISSHLGRRLYEVTKPGFSFLMLILFCSIFYYWCMFAFVIFPTEGDVRLCFCHRRYVGRYVYKHLCLWTTSWCQFKSDCHQTLSVIPLATGDEVIKFWKVKVVAGGMRSTERPSCCVYFRFSVLNKEIGWEERL